MHISDLSIIECRSRDIVQISGCQGRSPTITMSNIELRGNEHLRDTGILSIFGPCRLSLNNVEFVDNVGGALELDNGASVVATGCSFVGNFRSSGGGAVVMRSRVEFHSKNCTFEKNSAGQSGGAVHAKVSEGSLCSRMPYFRNFTHVHFLKWI